MNAEIIAQLALEREYEIRRQVARARRADPAPEAPRLNSAEMLRRWRMMAAKCLGKEEIQCPIADSCACPNPQACDCACA